MTPFKFRKAAPSQPGSDPATPSPLDPGLEHDPLTATWSPAPASGPVEVSDESTASVSEPATTETSPAPWPSWGGEPVDDAAFGMTVHIEDVGAEWDAIDSTVLAEDARYDDAEMTIIEEPEPPAPLLVASISLEDGTVADLVFLHDTDAFLVGRRQSTCDFVSDDPRVSREHFVIELVSGAPVLRDMSSSNGTWVNGDRVQDVVALSDGDALRFGRTEAVFTLAAPLS